MKDARLDVEWSVKTYGQGGALPGVGLVTREEPERVVVLAGLPRDIAERIVLDHNTRLHLMARLDELSARFKAAPALA